MEHYSFGFELELIINLNNTCSNDRIGDVVILLNKHLNEINSNIKFDYIDCYVSMVKMSIKYLYNNNKLYIRI